MRRRKAIEQRGTKGFNELWTVLRVDLVTNPGMLQKAGQKSPTTTQFFYLERILGGTTEEGRIFRQLLGSIMGAQLTT